MDKARARLDMRVLAYCLMPNHFHFVLWPFAGGDLSAWMQWLMTSHVRRHHQRHGSSGHIWQGRFKAFPIQQDQHLLTVLRYVERNPLSAGLVKRAVDWPWSSMGLRLGAAGDGHFCEAPVDIPRDWSNFVEQAQTPAEIDAMQRCVKRGAPFGEEGWTRKTAQRLSLESSMRPRGRPWKTKTN